MASFPIILPFSPSLFLSINMNISSDPFWEMNFGSYLKDDTFAGFSPLKLGKGIQTEAENKCPNP